MYSLPAILQQFEHCSFYFCCCCCSYVLEIFSILCCTFCSIPCKYNQHGVFGEENAFLFLLNSSKFNLQGQPWNLSKSMNFPSKVVEIPVCSDDIQIFSFGYSKRGLICQILSFCTKLSFLERLFNLFHRE